MKRVRDVLNVKGTEVFTIGPDDSVYNAIKIMSDNRIGALVVLDGEKLVGLLSETDYARKIVLMGRTSVNTMVREIMTDKVLYVSLDQDITECMALMTEHRFRHLPVIEDEQLAGLISIGDLVKSIIDDQTFTIEQLERYITG
jgi:CBS domain-containing protein